MAPMLCLTASSTKSRRSARRLLQLLQARMIVMRCAIAITKAKEALGIHADAYEVITDFQQEMAESAFALETIRSGGQDR